MNENYPDSLGGRPQPGHSPLVVPGGRRPARQEPIRWTLPGFCSGMRITTSFGDLPVQALRRRDPLRTSQGTLASVEWVDCIRLDEGFVAANPDAQPVRIPAGAFGPNRPERDVLVSPHQLVDVSASRFGSDFRLARDLLDRPGVMRNPSMMVSYHVFHCANPATVRVEGLCVRVTP